MTKPMTDKRLEEIAKKHFWNFDTVMEMLDEIRYLRKELAGRFAAFCPPEEAIVLREATTKAEAENAKLRKVVDLALGCWGPVDKRPKTDFVLRNQAFMKALRDLGKEKS